MTVEKRTHDVRTYDVDCVDLLAADETWASISSVTSDHASLTFGTPSINGAEITFADGHVSGAGKVVQFTIGGGTLGVNRSYVDCQIKVRGVTNKATALEATVVLRLKDTA